MIQSGKATKAAAILKRASELNPKSAEIQLDLGCALMAVDRPQEAAETFANVIRLDGRMPAAHFYLAQIFDGFGQEEMAMAGYKAAVALKPDLVDAQMRLGDFTLPAICERRRKAHSVLWPLRAHPDGVTARIAEARAIEASGDFEAALAKMRATVAAYPKSGKARDDSWQPPDSKRALGGGGGRV